MSNPISLGFREGQEISLVWIENEPVLREHNFGPLSSGGGAFRWMGFATLHLGQVQKHALWKEPPQTGLVFFLHSSVHIPPSTLVRGVWPSQLMKRFPTVDFVYSPWLHYIVRAIFYPPNCLSFLILMARAGAAKVKQ